MLDALGFLLRPYRLWLAAVLLLLAVGAVLESIGLSLFVPLLLALTDTTLSPESKDLGVFSTYLQYLSGYSRAQQVQLVTGLLVGAILVKNVFWYGGRLMGARLELSAIRDFRVRLFERYMAAPYYFFLDRKQGRLVHDLFTEGAMAGQTVSTCVLLLSHVLTAAVLYVLLVLISWQATLIVTATFAVLTLVFHGLSSVSGRLGQVRQKLVSEFVSLGTEVVLGIRLVKIFSAESRLAQRFAELAQQVRQANVRLQALSLVAQPAIEIAAVAVLAVFVLGLAAGAFGGAGVLMPLMVTFLVVLIRLFPVIGSLNKDFLELKADMASVRVVHELLSSSSLRAVGGGHRRFPGMREGIRFDGVTFRYPGNPDQPALRDLTLFVEKGKTTALVGPSGAGKTTIVDLLVGLYEPTTGLIAVDGVDLKELGLDTWLRAIGVVSQDTFIFNASIRENIAFALPTATEEQIVEAARQADAHEFIHALPQGYETIVGDRGMKLSGGERQRVAIARAILRNPPILIFDEASSSLDNESEKRVQHAINRLSKDRTVVIIAHRLSTIVGADTIVVLDRGLVVDQGTHAALLKRRGLYWKLYGRELHGSGLDEGAEGEETLTALAHAQRPLVGENAEIPAD